VPGERLVYKSCAEGACGLYLTGGVYDGTNTTRITDHMTDTNPEASPDGKYVAFMSRRDLNWEIYVLDLESYTVDRLTENAANDGLPIWSPDGRTIAFASDRNGEWAIWAMNPNGSNQRMLFSLPLGGSLHGDVWGAPQSSGWEEERLSWSP
jgi:dipeptidyl aminopeptidase/acylaminoacyl peptidase